MSKMSPAWAALLAATLFVTSPLQAQTTGNELRTWVSQAETHAPAPLLSRSALRLTGKQRIIAAALAPDGNKVGYLMRDGVTAHVVLYDVTNGKTTSLLTNDRLQNLQWTADSQALLLMMKDQVALLPLDTTHPPRYLYRLDSKRKQKMAGVVPGSASSQQLLIASSGNGKSQLTLVDGHGGERLLHEGDAFIKEAIADTGARHVFAKFITATALQIVALDQQGPRVLLQCKVTEVCEMDAYDEASDILWVRKHHDSGLMSLYSMVSTTGETTLEQQDPTRLSDVWQVCYAGNQPRITHFQDRGWRTQAVRKSDGNLLANLQRHFADSTFTVTGCSENHWLLREEGPRLQQYRYHVFDTGSRHITSLNDGGNAIDPQQLTDKHFLQYKASDGMLLNGYLSLPHGTALAQAPLVALIHGGPNGRAVPQYDEWVQLLTNRGYIVFEPNFRASVGFGRRYVLAANKEFGNGRVQQDMLDGLDWLLANGIGDRNRQAIVGGSFGGFAVLTALAYTPARFRAGVAYVPPADLGESIRHTRENPDNQDPSRDEFLRQLILDTDNTAEADAAYRRSPMNALSSIQAPLLIMAGGADDRVDIRHVRKYTSSLLLTRKPVSLLVDEHEGHGFVGDDATYALLYLLESFLAASLHGKVEPLQNANVMQYLRHNLLVNQNPQYTPTLE